MLYGNLGSMSWKKQSHLKKRNKKLVLSFVIAILIFGLSTYFVLSHSVSISQKAEQDNTPEVTVQPENNDQIAPALPSFSAEALQSAVNQWAGGVNGSASVVVSDSDGEILAELDPDQVYFAASIYKLYVAYEGYKQIDRGDTVGTDVYLNNNTRLECLDLMIRESDSPCAEKLWVELGKQNLTDTLVGYGLTNTSMTDITTTARDAAVMLSMIARSEGLSDQSIALLKESMRTQVYRDSLNKSFSEDVIVYNKIGFNEQQEYHDTAIVEFADGRKLILSVLTSGVGTRNITELGRLIEQAVTSVAL